MQRERILWGLQCLFRHAHAKFITCVADNVLTFHVSSPHPFIVSDCISFTVCCSPYSHTVLEADGHVHTVTCLRPFLPFSTHRFLHLFTFARPFFLLPFLPSLFFSSYFSFIPTPYAHFFHRLQLNSSARFIRRNYLLVCFSFHSS